MYKNILVAVDGSPTSNLALLEAAKLAKTDACLRIVYVVENPVWSIPLQAGVIYDVDLMHRSLVQTGKEILDRSKNLLMEKGVTARTHLVDLSETNATGGIAAALVRESQDWEADILVVGSHGRRGFRRLLMGSVADSVIRLATTPVLLVRASDTENVDEKAGKSD